MKIRTEILDILGNCRIEGNVLYLPDAQLERSIYTEVNKCLENIGGKWNRKAKGHIFDYDPADAFDSLIITGETEDMKKKFQFFPTPRWIAEKLCDMAELNGRCRVLEPSCGKGHIMDAIHERNTEKLCGIELNSDMAYFLKDKPYRTAAGVDFLSYSGAENWNRIIMNPPFTRQQDIDHILHAHEILLPDGILVSVVSESPFFRSDKKSTDFRAFLDDVAAEVVELEAGDFKESGTMVKTRIVKIRK